MMSLSDIKAGGDASIKKSDDAYAFLAQIPITKTAEESSISIRDEKRNRWNTCGTDTAGVTYAFKIFVTGIALFQVVQITRGIFEHW